MFGLLTLLSAPALATIDPECEGIPIPDDYNEQRQADFLNNFAALSTTFSPIHGPIPHKAGNAAIGIDVLGIPRLGCEERYVLNWTKTEDVNKTPVAPRLRFTVSTHKLGKRVTPYLGVGYIPPVTVAGVRSVILSYEMGLGIQYGRIQGGVRYHATMQKTVGDTAGAFSEDQPVYDDLFVGSTMGLDLLGGLPLGERVLGPVTFNELTPYVSLGLLDASTFYWIGDDGYVSDNLHPYFGPAISLGLDLLALKRVRFGGEFYAAPGGYKVPETTRVVDSSAQAWKYGRLYTARFRIGVEW